MFNIPLEKLYFNKTTTTFDNGRKRSDNAINYTQKGETEDRKGKLKTNINVCNWWKV